MTISIRPTSTPAMREPRRRLPVWTAVVVAVVLGGVLAFQTRSNGALGAGLGDGVTAAAIVFATGLALVSLALAFSGRGRRGLRRVSDEVRGRTFPAWMLLGGAIGSVFVVSQGLVGATLGTAMFTIAGVAGQTVSGLVLDQMGIGPGGRRPVTPLRLAGSLLGLVAVGLAVVSELGGPISVWLLALPLVGGLCLGSQQAVNGRVRVVADSPVTSTFINFVTGTVVLLIIVSIRAFTVGLPTHFPTEPWMYFGGITAVIFIAITSVLVRITGVLLLGLGTVAGQLITSLALEILLPSGSSPIGWSTVVGTGLALIAVAVTSAGSRSASTPSIDPTPSTPPNH
jgi:transporter family-2 protein